MVPNSSLAPIGPEIFYIAGCQRSGTTMLRLVLEAHPEISCFDEDLSYRLLPRIRGWRARRVVRRCGTRLVGFKIPRFTEQLLDERMRDPDYGTFPSFRENGERVLFLHRDVRDVVASMLRLRQPDGSPWMERYGRPILSFRSREAAFSRQYEEALERVRASGFAPHCVGALYWRYKTDAYFAYRAAGLAVLGVGYERLVTAPRAELARILNFLGVRWDDAVLTHHRARHPEILPGGTAIGGTDPGRSIDSSSVQRFAGTLDARQIDDVTRIAGPTVERVRAALGG